MSITRCLHFIAIAILPCAALQLIEDPVIGFTAQIPDTWTSKTVKENHHTFRDTSGVCHAIIGIIRHSINRSKYDAQGWCRDMSFSYHLMVESNPVYGIVHMKKETVIDSLFAIKINASYSDTALNIWSEHVRFTSIDSRGYELYALADTADMQAHFDFYTAILDNVHIMKALNAKDTSAIMQGMYT
ncbi:MAG: hypothetical protein GF350_15455, partial [Chitinivibrionales bacterium]|nr:hypothetical protein [Chitinivibrionales bacterium]